MKKFPALLLACFLAALTTAQDAAKKTPPAAPEPAGPAISTLMASAARVTEPLVLNDGVLSQPQMTDLTEGGKAVFEFNITKAGSYAIHAMVDASSEDSNSFFLNIDAPPEDPLAIWDIDVTSGFEERIVNWRGKGDAENGEFKPKLFTLSAGTHKLFLVGREPAKLKSLTIRPAK